MSLLLLFQYPVFYDVEFVAAQRPVETPQVVAEAVKEIEKITLPKKVFPKRIRKTAKIAVGVPGKIPDSFYALDVLFPFSNENLHFSTSDVLKPGGIEKAVNLLNNYRNELLTERLKLLDEQRNRLRMEREAKLIDEALRKFQDTQDAILALLVLRGQILEENKRVMQFLGLEEDEDLFYLQ